MENIDLSENVKLDESCVIVDNSFLYEVSRRNRRLRSYKVLLSLSLSLSLSLYVCVCARAGARVWIGGCASFGVGGVFGAVHIFSK